MGADYIEPARQRGQRGVRGQVARRRAHDPAFGAGVVAQAVGEDGEEFLGGPAAGAHQVHVAEPVLVLGVAGGELGTDVRVTGFARLALGEGVEKPTEPDLASEVAAMAAGALANMSATSP